MKILEIAKEAKPVIDGFSAVMELMKEVQKIGDLSAIEQEAKAAAEGAVSLAELQRVKLVEVTAEIDEAVAKLALLEDKLSKEKALAKAEIAELSAKAKYEAADLVKGAKEYRAQLGAENEKLRIENAKVKQELQQASSDLVLVKEKIAALKKSAIDLLG